MSTILTQPYTGIKYYKANIYPIVPMDSTDLYFITSDGDRLDNLANMYYKDPTLWWIISTVNNNVNGGSLFPTPGTQLRIPLNLNRVLSIFNNANS
jgi:hypothetical protein